ncbi:MAG: hypothetical protein AAGL97_01330 [Pseudomonadota bacterium]
MKHIGKIAIAGVGLVLLTACETTPTTSGPSPESTVQQINAVKAQSASEDNAASRIEKLKGLLASAETRVAETTDKPALNLAWTFTAMTAADALTAIPGQSTAAFADAASKTLSYADAASTACLDIGASGIDTRQGNFCGMALAVRRLNDSGKAVQAFSDATDADDWVGSKAASEGFGQQVSTNWTAYTAEAEQLALSEQNQTPFKRMALQEACEFQVAQGQANLLGNPSMEEDVRDAKDAYWTAMATAASFLEIESEASVCESEPDSRACKRETEIKVAETCQSL